ncbi:hypothetical protein BDQ17DRAFT_1168364, partial [Cyathus striatus]
FVTVTKLASGSILSEVDSDNTANWLREIDHAKAVTDTLGIEGSFIRRMYPVMVKMAPVIFDPNSEGHVEEFQEANSIAKEDWGGAQWMKPKERRRPDQQYAYLTISIANDNKAN